MRLTTVLVVMTALYLVSLGTAYIAIDVAWSRREDVMWETTRTLKITATKVFLLLFASFLMNLACTFLGGAAIARKVPFDEWGNANAQMALIFIGTTIAIFTGAMLGYISFIALLEIWRTKSELFAE
jgi:hypothetical protein